MGSETVMQIGFAQDGTVLPIRKGGTASILTLMDALAQSGAVVPNLLWCYRGWGSLRQYCRRPFRTIAVDPETYYGAPASLAVAIRAFGLRAVHLYSAEEVLSLGVSLRRLGTPVIYEVLNIEHVLARQLGADGGTIRRNTALQQRALRLADWVLCRSDDDRRAAIALGADPRRTMTYVSGIAVPDGLRPHRHVPSHSIVFLGHLFYEPNRRAVALISNTILPRLRARDPRYTVDVIGEYTHSFVRQFRAQGLRFIGGVDALHRTLARYDVAVSPVLEGSGTSVKLLDYLAAGVPVITTPMGIRGLSPSPEPYLTVESDPAHFASRIDEMMVQYGRYRRRAERGVAFIRAHYRWSSTVSNLIRLYRTL